MENRRLKMDRKGLFIVEPIFIWCLRKGIEYRDDDDFIYSILTDDSIDLQLDNINKDLRNWKRVADWKLTYITEEEYELLLNKFGYE